MIEYYLMNTLSPVNVLHEAPSSRTNGKKIGPNHAEHDGDCSDPTCSVEAPHNHTSENGCLSCIKEYLENLFPLEHTIKELKSVNSIGKQLLLMASNLTPAIAMTEILKPFHVDSFIASPLAISAMHLTNRGTNHLHKLLFTSLSSVGVVALQKFANLPRILIRPIMALAVFFIEKTGKEKHIDKRHIHTAECDHSHHEHDHVHTAECNHTHEVTHDEKKSKDSWISKAEWIKLAKLQGQINTVPSIVNFGINKLREANDMNDNWAKKFLGNIGISALQIAALSLGFVGLGHLIDKMLLKFNFVSNEESLAMRAEGAVCACCGAPVCVAEAASEVGSIAATF